MEIRHNTRHLEEALALVAREREAPTKIRRRLATAAAIAIAAIGIGLGLWLGLHRGEGGWVLSSPLPAPTVTVTSTPQFFPTPGPTVTVTASPTPLPSPSPVPMATPTDLHTPVVNYTKFALQTVRLFGRDWELQAGHQFATETQKDWDAAWCYINTQIGGFTARVDLANRLHSYSNPTGPIASSDTFQRIGLEDQQASELASRCPWLDGKVFSVADLISVPRPAPSGLTPTPTISNTPPNTDTSIPASSPFATSDGYDAVGNDLPGMPVESNSLEDCQQNCGQNLSCNAFTFNKKHDKCFLKSAARILTPSAQAVSGYKSATAGNYNSPTLSQLKVHNKSAVMGQWARGLIVPSFDICLMACEREKSFCAGVNFDLMTSECNLFGSVTGTVNAPTMLSGER